MDSLRNEMMAEAAAGKSRDTILELIDESVIYSTEIGVIVQFLKSLPGTGRTLRLVASNYVCEMLKTMNIHRIPNFTLNTSLEDVQTQIPGVDLGVR